MNSVSLVLPLADGGKPVIPSFGGATPCVRNNRGFCWGWFSSHWGDVFGPALVQHIVLTVVAVGIGSVIALAAAIAAYRFGWLAPPVTAFTGFLYTIPSLALFQILVPVTGLTIFTAEIALVSYTLLIIFRNALTGLTEVPDEVREAANGMGLTPTQRLLRVELPLAVPAIVAGVRVAVVTVISLGTVAAYVVNMGLGAPILNALNSGPFKTEVVGGAVLAILLAVVADGVLVIVQRLITPWTAARAGGAVRRGPRVGLRRLVPSRVAARGGMTALILLPLMLAESTHGKAATGGGVGQAFVRAFPFIVDHPALVLQKVVEHLEVSFAAVGISIAIAVPIGMWLGHIHKGSFVAINVGNMGRALPSLAVLSLLLVLVGIGFTNVMIALIILAVPPILTNAYVAVDEVDRDTVEAARGMGMRPLEVLRRVEVPLALPLMFVGIRTATVYVIATATLAGIFGGGTLGAIIVNQASYGLSGVLAGAILVAALALTFELGFGGVQRAITPRGLRTRPGRANAADKTEAPETVGA
ncbi:MAG: ABC transporter permease [Streptosporangiaceae bacterium]